MDRRGHGHAAGGYSLPRLGEHVSALRARPVVPQEMASERPGWRSDHRPLRRRYRCRVPTQAGCGAIPPRRSGEAGPVRSQPSPGQDPFRGVWPVRVTEPSSARGGQAGDFRLSGLHALLQDNPERTLSAAPAEDKNGRKPIAKRWGSTGPWRASRRCSASAGTTASGKLEGGSGGSAMAGSTTLPSRGRAGSSVRSTAGCNACGCGRYAAGPSEPASSGSVWNA